LKLPVVTADLMFLRGLPNALGNSPAQHAIHDRMVDQARMLVAF